MRRLKLLGLALAIGMLPGAALAQEAAPGDAEAAATIEASEAAGIDPAAAADAAAEAGETTLVPSVGGGLTSAGTPADSNLGQPLGGFAIQPQVTELGQRASDFNTALLIIMAVVTLIVFALLFWSIVRYSRRRNSVPSRTTHNVAVEIIWTVLPVLILVGIAIPSFQLLAAQYDPPEADLTIKAIGHQWYWEYEYPDQGGFGFDSIMLPNEDADEAGEPRLLATDNRVVVPVDSTVKVLVTSVDVLHSWAIPAFWVKMDAVPGKINETWFRAEQPGVYYGQCSELCGTRHAFMPIAVEVVQQDVFDAWVARRQADAGIDPAELAAEAAAAEAEAMGAGAPDDELTPEEVPVPTAAPVEANADEAEPVDTPTPTTGAVAEQAATEN